MLHKRTTEQPTDLEDASRRVCDLQAHLRDAIAADEDLAKPTEEERLYEERRSSEAGGLCRFAAALVDEAHALNALDYPDDMFPDQRTSSLLHDAASSCNGLLRSARSVMAAGLSMMLPDSADVDEDVLSEAAHDAVEIALCRSDQVTDPMLLVVLYEMRLAAKQGILRDSTNDIHIDLFDDYGGHGSRDDVGALDDSGCGQVAAQESAPASHRSEHRAADVITEDDYDLSDGEVLEKYGWDVLADSLGLPCFLGDALVAAAAMRGESR